MNVTFRTLESGELELDYHERSRFESQWSATLYLLSYELGKLGAETVTIKLALEAGTYAWTGGPVRTRAHPARKWRWSGR